MHLDGKGHRAGKAMFWTKWSIMKCYVCGQDASVSMREQAMFMGREFTKFLCKDCYDNKRWK